MWSGMCRREVFCDGREKSVKRGEVRRVARVNDVVVEPELAPPLLPRRRDSLEHVRRDAQAARRAVAAPPHQRFRAHPKLNLLPARPPMVIRVIHVTKDRKSTRL